MKNFVKHIDTNVWLTAAEELGLSIKILDEEFNYAEVYNNAKSLRIIENKTSLNDVIAYKFARNKYFTNKILQSQNLPVPNFKRFKFSAYESLEEMAKDIFESIGSFEKNVLKPVDQSLGAGVYIDLRDYEEILAAVKSINAMKSRGIIVEEFIYGKEFRIVAFKGEVIDILLRKPGSLQGNGIDTISKLVDKKSEQRTSSGFNAIKVDDDFLNNIRKNGYTLESILEDGKEIIFRNVCNFARGGTVSRVNLKDVAPEYLKNFQKIQEVSRLNMIGIDFICRDLSVFDPKAAINEINSSPMIDLHYYASLESNENDPFYIPKYILSKYFNS
jgi:cyanophycin synthetase